jgi:hypothetical protein
MRGVDAAAVAVRGALGVGGAPNRTMHPASTSEARAIFMENLRSIGWTGRGEGRASSGASARPAAKAAQGGTERSLSIPWGSCGGQTDLDPAPPKRSVKFPPGPDEEGPETDSIRS